MDKKKHLFTTVLIGMVAIATLQAQDNQQTGPLAKNRKLWKNPRVTTQVVIKDHQHKNVTGPLAKNRKIWEDTCASYPVLFRKDRKLTGGLAKNALPERGNYWEPDTTMVTK